MQLGLPHLRQRSSIKVVVSQGPGHLILSGAGSQQGVPMNFAKHPIAAGIAAFALLWGAGLHAGSSPAAPASGDAAETIIRYALAPSPLDEDLRQLTDEIGGRVTGSAVMARAVAWGVNGFKAAGVSVHTEAYKLPATWEERASQFQLLGPV